MDREKTIIVVQETVHETLTVLGFDMSNPTEVQKDVAHLSQSRKYWELILNRSLLVTVTVLVGGFLSFLGYAAIHALTLAGAN